MDTHNSDCAVHNAPAHTPGPCDCGFEVDALVARSMKPGNVDNLAKGRVADIRNVLPVGVPLGDGPLSDCFEVPRPPAIFTQIDDELRAIKAEAEQREALKVEALALIVIIVERTCDIESVGLTLGEPWASARDLIARLAQ